MPYGPYSGNVIQIGDEGTAGTAVAATTVWRGPAASIVDASVTEFVDAQAGMYAPILDSYQPSKLARLGFPETELTFEQFGHVLQASIEDVAAAGAGPYTWTYSMPTTSAPTIQTKTLETGNVIAGDAGEMEYSFVESFSIRANAEEAWRVQSAWVGRQRTAAALTGSLSTPTVENALFGKSSFYVDAGGGAIGTTQVQGVLKQAEINVTSGLKPLFTGDGGNLYFYTVKRDGWTATYRLQVELESDTGFLAAERTAFTNRTIRLIQLVTPGSGSKQITVQFAGVHESVGDYENADGNTVVTLQGRIGYSSTDSQSLDFILASAVNTWPL